MTQLLLLLETVLLLLLAYAVIMRGKEAKRLARLADESSRDLAAANLRLLQEGKDREFAEQALRDSEELYRGLFQNSHSVMMLVDPETLRIVDANPAACEFYGYPSAQCRQLTMDQLNTLSAEEVRRLMAKASVLEQNIFEFTHRLANGEKREVEVHSGPVRIKDKLLLYSLIHDITNRKRLEKALRESEENLRASLQQMEFIVEATDLGVWTRELPGDRLRCNRQTKEHFWLPPEAEVTYKGFLAILHPDDRGTIRQAMVEAVRNHGLFEGTFRAIAPDGRSRWVRASGRATYDDAGHPVSVSGITQDATNQKLIEDVLTQAVAERERLLQELQEEKELLEKRVIQRTQDLQDFVHISSHDLQEPLRKIQTFGERLRTVYGDKLDERGRDYLHRMENAAARMSALLHSLLAYSRVTSRPAPFTPVDLATIVEEAKADLTVRRQETGGTVEIGTLPTVDADRPQIRQVFENLIGNALKFHRENVPPVVRIHCRNLAADGQTCENGQCEIVVEDNGIGFDIQYLPKIFQPFERLHGKTGSFEGTGMGLAIVRRIVERHKGDVTATSEPGKGSTFIVTIPQHQKPEAC